MNLKDKLDAFKTMAEVKIFGKRIPLAVRFQLTNRCTLKCKYCSLWHSESKELPTQQIFIILDQLSNLGTKRISFSGGEALLRRDIAEIISYCRKKGIYPEINSNGLLIPEKISKIRDLDFLKLSLDGPEMVHDELRCRGSFKAVIKAADVAYKNKINFGFACTLTKFNIDSLDSILDITKKYNTIVAFQPLKRLYRGMNQIKDFLPEQKKFQSAVYRLIMEKRSGNRHIRNSLANLFHIYNWPQYKRLKCWAGRIFCIIETNGDLYPCDRIEYNSTMPNCVNLGVRKALEKLPEVNCSGCGFCGSLELNHLMCLRFNVLFSIKKIINNKYSFS